jgi:hemoglobin/transferrin/lactoferrin receptor protein
MKKTIFLLIIIFMMAFTLLAGEQTKDKKKDKKETKKSPAADMNKNDKTNQPLLHYEVTITATRKEKPAIELAMPVTVDNRQKIEEWAPNNVAELISKHPGMDVTGVSPNQTRPVIRGLRGQRILLLEDGIRLNNSRRQQDFGEIPSLVDIGQVERVEVIRGPASVLYGSDAIGGVVNIITREPAAGKDGESISGSLAMHFDTAGNQHKETVGLNGKSGKFRLQLNGNYRKAYDFSSPSGSFGAINLQKEVKVKDSGLQDHNLSAIISFRPDEHQHLDLKHEYYNANNSGFGFVEPELYAPNTSRIRITYPFQVFNKTVLHYEHRSLHSFAADGLSAQFYLIQNNRKLENDIFIPVNAPNLPVGAGISINGKNTTDISTFGFRLEATKVLFGRHILVYGSDFFNDSANSNDESTTRIINMGPIPAQTDQTPELPAARYSSLGFFIQDDIKLSDRFSSIIGLRYQAVKAETFFTPGLENIPLQKSTDNTMTGAANLIYGLSDNLNIYLSIGRAFRSPNLIERFFNGIAPEGGAFQSRNLDLKAETSFNAELGLKYRLSSFYLEADYFNNTINDGIRIVPTGAKINGLPEYRNMNIDKLRVQGIECTLDYKFTFGLVVAANFTWFKSRDLINETIPYANAYSSRLNFILRYEAPRGIWWSEYRLRSNGKQLDMFIEKNPIGPYIPGYIIHDLAAGITLFKKSHFPQRLGFVLGNITNKLYAEFSNATFFRPCPKRHLAVTWSTVF